MQTKSQFEGDTPPNCDVMFAFLNAVSHSISKSGLSRMGIIDRMNEALGGEITINTGKFNKWLAPSEDRQIPMIYVPALCWALRDTSVIDALLQPIHFKTVDQRGQTLQLAAQYQMQARSLMEKAEEMMASVAA